jgi:hypothetical protein
VLINGLRRHELKAEERAEGEEHAIYGMTEMTPACHERYHGKSVLWRSQRVRARDCTESKARALLRPSCSNSPQPDLVRVVSQDDSDGQIVNGSVTDLPSRIRCGLARSMTNGSLRREARSARLLQLDATAHCGRFSSCELAVRQQWWCGPGNAQEIKLS